MERRCDKCEFWTHVKEENVRPPYDKYGECRINPPIIPLIQPENEYWYFVFPMTPPDCWCGKFKGKEA